MLAMIWQARQGVLTGGHDADHYAADMLGPWVPDWTWAYNGWTRAIWGPLTYSYEEKSVCLGPAAVIAVFLGMTCGGTRRLRLGARSLFAMIAALFILLSFGPTWRFWTVPITNLTPYRLLMTIFPSLQAAGSVGRMIIMTQLAFSVLAADGLGRLSDLKPPTLRSAAMLLVAAGLYWNRNPERS